MLGFDEIENLFPEDSDGCYCRDSDGAIVSSAAWLHKFANAVAEHEREACIEEVRAVGGPFAVECETLIRARSTANRPARSAKDKDATNST